VQEPVLDKSDDFNNLLTVITGYNEMVSKALPQNDRLRLYVEEIGRAAEEARDLTQQLLAVSRKQVTTPKPLNLNDVVMDAERMLRRVIGEDIQLVSRLDPQLGQTKADANQIRQVIMNLVVNAREAMPNGGKLTIETCNVDVDEKTSSESSGAASGRHVLMSVSNTGTGITEEDRRNIFEPFFTTKGYGKGTGLGLSTVYGIVQQSGGLIDVWTRIGEGSAFRIYLPRIDAGLLEESPVPSSTVPGRRRNCASGRG
jgi:two-component system cell cycle sensor histidine kinase/response regulator CckA